MVVVVVVVVVMENHYIFFCDSFPTDGQLVIEGTITVTFATAAAPNEKITETLFPARHKITLPLNSLNNYFQSCEIAFNHHTKLDCDRLVQLKMF